MAVKLAGYRLVYQCSECDLAVWSDEALGVNRPCAARRAGVRCRGILVYQGRAVARR